MPQTLTKYFGNLEYREDDVVQFPGGLPAFEEELWFLVIEPPERAPLRFLQSLRQPSLCFLALPISIVDPNYRLAMTAEDLASLDLDTARQPIIDTEIECLVVLVAPQDSVPSVNLLAPIVINKRTAIGLQAIRIDSTYSHAHPLAEPETICS